MQVKSKITITLPNGIKIKCNSDQIGDVMKNISIVTPSIPDIPQYIPNIPWWYPDKPWQPMYPVWC